MQIDIQTDVLHNLSERTGSLMYMPPEIIRGEKYNESADVFSFIMVLYEVLSKFKNIYKCTTGTGRAMEEVKQWAVAVSEGYRPAVKENWPTGIKELITECWAASPGDRPTMANVIERLEAILKSGAFLIPEAIPEKDYAIGRPRRFCCF